MVNKQTGLATDSRDWSKVTDRKIYILRYFVGIFFPDVPFKDFYLQKRVRNPKSHLFVELTYLT